MQQIVSQGGDRDAAIAVWEELKDSTHGNGFTPAPSDSLSSLFGIAEEELDEDLILAILQKLNVPIPDQEFVSAFGVVDTPLQVARFVAL